MPLQLYGRGLMYWGWRSQRLSHLCGTNFVAIELQSCMFKYELGPEGRPHFK